MPRGNDSREALSELADKFGRGVGNASDLIEATLGRNSEALRRAENLPLDEEATEQAKKQVVGQKLDGAEVIDAAVRGGTTIVVTEEEDGRRYIVALDDHGKPSTTDSEKQKAAEKSSS